MFSKFKNLVKFALLILMSALALALLLVVIRTKKSSVQKQIENREHVNKQFIIAEIKNNANLVLFEKTSSGTVETTEWSGDEQALEKIKKFPSGNFDIFFNDGYNSVLYIDYKLQNDFTLNHPNLISKTKYIPVNNGIIEFEINSVKYHIPVADLFDENY